MIRVVDLCFASRNGPSPRILFHNLSAHFDAFERVGILADRGSGKSTLAKLLSGILVPDSGHVIAQGKISLPLGFGAALHPEMSVRRNISILCRSSGSDVDEASALAATLGRLGDLFEQPVKRLSWAERRALSFCLSLADHSDVYIADEALSFGDEEQRSTAKRIIEARLDAATLILLSHNPKQLTAACDRFYILRNCRLEPCSDLDGTRAKGSEAEEIASTAATYEWYDE